MAAPFPNYVYQPRLPRRRPLPTMGNDMRQLPPGYGMPPQAPVAPPAAPTSYGPPDLTDLARKLGRGPLEFMPPGMSGPGWDEKRLGPRPRVPGFGGGGMGMGQIGRGMAGNPFNDIMPPSYGL